MGLEILDTDVIQIFFPYVWPVHSKSLQFRAVLVGCCLLASNALNVLVPRQLGIMVDGVNNHIQGNFANAILRTID